jgi:hypothetical protein
LACSEKMLELTRSAVGVAPNEYGKRQSFKGGTFRHGAL